MLPPKFHVAVLVRIDDISNHRDFSFLKLSFLSYRFPISFLSIISARVLYKSKVDGLIYTLNMIDTPGHVDFSYEVSRSLAACEGGILVVDASQGIEAQTLANVYLAIDNDLEIIPVLNKIDLPAADPDRVAMEIEETIGLDCTDIIQASAKSGIGIDDILESIVRTIPPPKAALDKPFRALIFDSYYDSYRGIGKKIAKY